MGYVLIVYKGWRSISTTPAEASTLLPIVVIHMQIEYKMKSPVTKQNSGVFCWGLPEKLRAYRAGNASLSGGNPNLTLKQNISNASQSKD